MNALLMVLCLAQASGQPQAPGPQGPTVSLQQMLEAADKGNLDQRISVEQYNRATAEYRQAWGGLLPALTATGGWTHNQYAAQFNNPLTMTTLTIQPQDQFDAVLRVDLPLIDSARWLRTAASSAASTAAEQRQAFTKDQVKRTVAATYYSYAASLALRQSSQRAVTVAEAQLRLQEIRERAGAATELELVRARAEVQRNRQTAADIQRLVAVTRRTLTTQTGMDPGEAAALPEGKLTDVPTLNELEGRVEGLPAIKAAEADLLASGRLLTAARLQALPVIGAQFTERFTNATGFIGRSDSYNLGVNLTWRLDVPTFQGMSAQSAAEATASLNLERTRLQARDQINSDWQTLQAAMTKLQAAQGQVDAARRAQQVANTRYEAGAATQLDLISADRDLFSAEAGHIQARTELASARVAVAISAGLPIEVE